MIIVDECSRLSWPYFLAKKPDVPAVLAKFLTTAVRGALRPPWSVCARTMAPSSRSRRPWRYWATIRSIPLENSPVDSPKHKSMAERFIAMTLELAMASCP